MQENNQSNAANFKMIQFIPLASRRSAGGDGGGEDQMNGDDYNFEWTLSLAKYRSPHTDLIKNYMNQELIPDYEYPPVINNDDNDDSILRQFENIKFNHDGISNTIHMILYDHYDRMMNNSDDNSSANGGRLNNNHQIGNPYYRFEELKQLWIGYSDWKMKCTVTKKKQRKIDTTTTTTTATDQTNSKPMFLVFEGIDTVADIKIIKSTTASTTTTNNDKKVIVNHSVISLSVDNMFQYHVIDLSKLLILADSNNDDSCDDELFTIEILLKSALEECKERLKLHSEEEEPYEIPCPSYTRDFHTRGRNFLRKEGCSFGWDWGPAFVQSGLHRPCYLVVMNTSNSTNDLNNQKRACFIKECSVFQRDFKYYNELPSVKCQSVTLDIGVYLCGNYENCQQMRDDIQTIGWSLKKDGNDMTTCDDYKQVIVSSNDWKIEKDDELENTFILTFTIPELKNVELWYPNGYGHQTLYNFEISILEGPNTQSKTTSVGFRKVELDTSIDEFGSKFQFKINEIPIYAKGSNWIPTDCFSSRSMKGLDHLEFLLKSAHDCHMNCMRIWGGGQYESDHFYHLCDKYGILLWHDLMFACSLYPSHSAFLHSCRVEAIQQLRRLQHHPCIALYAGNNENEEALLSWPECIESPHKQRLFVDYHKLYYDTLYRAVLKEDQDSRPFWPSSPSNGIMKYGNPQDLTRGDAHYWRVWHGGKPFDNYLTVTPRFSSEFGFQSLPSYESLLPFIVGDDNNNSNNNNKDNNNNMEQQIIMDDSAATSAMNISSPEMEYRQRSYAVGNKCILEHISREFRFPKSFKELVYISQILQALAIKTACEHWRRQSKICSGVLYWQLNDIWIGNSWSSLEWNGKWKLLQFYARDFLAPSLLSSVENKDNHCLDIWFTTDLLQSLKLNQLSIDFFSYENGEKLFSKTVEINQQVPGASSQVIHSLDMIELKVEKSRTKGFFKFSLNINDDHLNSKDTTNTTTTTTNTTTTIVNYHFLTELKKANLGKSNVQIVDIQQEDNDCNNVILTLKCQDEGSPSLFTYLVIDNEKQDTIVKTSLEFDLDHLSDNGFHLMPGEEKKIIIHKRPSLRRSSDVEFYRKHLHIMNLRDSY